ncbi:MAG: hypothetical protein IH851_12180 [Armatimonadetes bacterium]|nr:hypothetical protein [Armatimonadota bacterium]
MSNIGIIRSAVTVLAWVVLVGGYFIHQVNQLSGGDVKDWYEAVGPSNLWLGWLLLIVGVALSVLRDEEGGGTA